MGKQSEHENNGHVTVELYLDFKLLRQQKRDLMNSADVPEDSLNGIVDVIEVIQNAAAAVHGHEFVFGDELDENAD